MRADLVTRANVWGDWWWPRDDHMAFEPISDEARRASRLRGVVQAVKKREQILVLQAGGNAGMMPVLLSHPVECHVLSFEPYWPNYLAMVRNVNDRKANVTPVFGALSDKPGWSSIECEENELGNYGAVYARGRHRFVQGLSPTFTLEQFQSYAADFIWLDTEGSEPAILSRAIHLMASVNPPLIAVELKGLSKRYGTNDAAFRDWMREMRYVDMHSWGRDVLFAHQSELAAAEKACVDYLSM